MGVVISRSQPTDWACHTAAVAGAVVCALCGESRKCFELAQRRSPRRVRICEDKCMAPDTGWVPGKRARWNDLQVSAWCRLVHELSQIDAPTPMAPIKAATDRAIGDQLPPKEVRRVLSRRWPGTAVPGHREPPPSGGLFDGAQYEVPPSERLKGGVA